MGDEETHPAMYTSQRWPLRRTEGCALVTATCDQKDVAQRVPAAPTETGCPPMTVEIARALCAHQSSMRTVRVVRGWSAMWVLRLEQKWV